jgi:hypothetical protein
MKRIAFLLALTLLIGCSAHVVQKKTESGVQNCLGNTEMPAELEDSFEPVEDKSLLNLALGKPNEGKLCWGQVYQSKEDSKVTVYRAWNSTNPNSKMGNWWAFQKPNGKVSLYRYEYEICYQWSPLDKLDCCTLKPGVKIVVGTGQSAKCSQYLTYPTSEQKQIYIKDASESVIDCTVYDLIFNWQ